MANIRDLFGAAYTDEWNRPTALTAAELEWFQRTVQRVLAATGISIEVYTADHEAIGERYEDALGIHWLFPRSGDEFVTVDCYYIHERYQVEVCGSRCIFERHPLVEVICHELAHMRYQRHTRYHAALTARYMEMVNAAA